MQSESQTAASDALAFAPVTIGAASTEQAQTIWRVEAVSRADIEGCPRWSRAFANERKDRRYYEIVEDTVHQGFDHRYFVLKDESGEVRAVQPFFINDQDLLAGTGPSAMTAVSWARRLWPRFLRMRTLMIGCAAGEGHLDAHDGVSPSIVANSLAAGLKEQARRFKTGLIVFKEFPAADRAALRCLKEHGFARMPSMPMTRLKLDFASFEDYLSKALSRNTRSQLRRKFKESEQRARLEMRVVTDIAPYADEIYPLYLGVYERSTLRFEKLTPDYFSRISERMPDKALFFLWLHEGKVVAFNFCTIHEGSICSEYLGFDYGIAFDLNLYYIVARGVISWAIDNKCEWYCSTALNYEPKYRLRQELVPLDLYVRHTSPVVNFFMKRLLPYLEPTRYDKLLQRFPNYAGLHSDR